VVTRVRPTSGAHPANGDTIFFSPPLVINEQEVDRLVAAARDAVKAACA
jgi:adenosylmethionine-8-amino-7-oxononanoate aminotransferase